MNGLMALAVIVIVALAGYAGWLVGRLWRQRQRLRRQEDRRRTESLDGLWILARCLAAEQVNVSEASLRMAVLLDNLEGPMRPSTDLSAIHRLAESCRGFALGEARRRLSPEERRRQDDERERLEAEQGDAVRQATQRLLVVLPAWRGGSR